MRRLPRIPARWTRRRHSTPILHPGEESYPLKLGQMLYHGSNDPIRTLQPGSFLTPYTAIARGYARNWRSGYGDMRDESGFVSRFALLRLPRLVLFDTEKHVENYCGWVYFMHDADLHPDMHHARRARVLAHVAPPDCDGWILPDYEVVLWRPHQFVKFWGMREWRWNEAPMIGGPRPKKKPKGSLDGLGEASYDDVDFHFDEVPDRPFEPYGPIPVSMLQNSAGGDE